MGNTITQGVSYKDQDIVGGTILGHGTTATAATATLGFYGITPIVRRTYTASVHNTTALASSTDFNATHLAAVQELQKTMIALGIWATV